MELQNFTSIRCACYYFTSPNGLRIRPHEQKQKFPIVKVIITSVFCTNSLLNRSMFTPITLVFRIFSKKVTFQPNFFSCMTHLKLLLLKPRLSGKKLSILDLFGNSKWIYLFFQKVT
jgi:hypothetical protein